MIPLKREIHAGDTGSDVEGAGRALCRSGLYVPIRVFSALPAVARRRAHRSFVNAVKRLQKGERWPEDGVYGQGEHQALLDAGAFDPKALALYRSYRVREVPNLGPVWKGGKSVLDHDLTHATSGIPLYPAFDDAFVEGREIIAPEPLVVTRPSSSRPGLAFYATGRSKLRYWFGHLDRTHMPGREFKTGAVVGLVARNNIGGGPHVHVGLNVELLLGMGRELVHHTNYTHGAPTVGQQLEKALA